MTSTLFTFYGYLRAGNDDDDATKAPTQPVRPYNKCAVQLKSSRCSTEIFCRVTYVLDVPTPHSEPSNAFHLCKFNYEIPADRNYHFNPRAVPLCSFSFSAHTCLTHPCWQGCWLITSSAAGLRCGSHPSYPGTPQVSTFWWQRLAEGKSVKARLLSSLLRWFCLSLLSCRIINPSLQRKVLSSILTSPHFKGFSTAKTAFAGSWRTNLRCT